MDDSNIWIVDINGVNLRKLVDQRDIQLYPDFHPNGKKIIYSSTIYAPFCVIWHDLWAINLDGTGAERILCNDAANIQAKWSPDGKKIVFASNKTGNMEIWLMDIESKKLKQLTYNPAYNASPCWSPDGEYICFISNRCGKMAIWIMDKNGKNLYSTLTPKNQNLPIFGHFSPVISDVPTTFFPISSTRGGTAMPAALNPK